MVYRRFRNIFGKEKIRYLILKRRLHWSGWEFPKGGIEKGERLIDAVKREAREETGQEGINFKDYKISGKYPYKKELKDRPGIIGQTYHLFSCEVKTSKIKMGKEEHSSYKWRGFEKAEKMLTWENEKKCLRVVNKKISENR